MENKRKSMYISGSAAPAEYTVPQRKKSRTGVKTNTHTNDEISNIPVIREIRNKKVKRKLKAGMVGKVFILFAVGMLVIFRYAQITEIGYNNNKLKAQYEELMNENSRIKVDIEKSINLANVRSIAEDKLNMQKPEEHQIIYVEPEMPDRTDYYGEEEKEKGLFASAFDWIKSFLGFIE